MYIFFFGAIVTWLENCGGKVVGWGWSHWNLETGDLRDFRHVATPSCKFITHGFMLLFTKNSPRQGNSGVWATC